MKKYILKAWNEIKNGQNIDIYLTLIVCFILLWLDILNLTSQETVSSGILAVLLLLAFSTLNSRQINGDLQQVIHDMQVAQTSIGFFHEWNDATFNQYLISAKEINMLSISPYEFMTYNAEKLKELIKQGTTLKIIMLNPDGDSVKAASHIFYGAAQKDDYIPNQIRMTLQELQEIANDSVKSKIQVRLIDFVPPYVITQIVNQNNSTIFVTINGINQPFSSRPSFRLQRNSDGKWFDFYQKSFENSWNSRGAKEFDIIPVDN